MADPGRATRIGPDYCADSMERYDVAVSFASQQRDYVGRVVIAARAVGLRVFYDQDMTHEWWGRNFLIEQRKVYVRQSLHFVPFISVEYLARPYPRDELLYAGLRSVEELGENYVLPVLVGDVRVPPEILHPHIGYLRAEDHPPKRLACAIKDKIRVTRGRACRSRTPTSDRRTQLDRF